MVLILAGLSPNIFQTTIFWFFQASKTIRKCFDSKQTDGTKIKYHTLNVLENGSQQFVYVNFYRCANISVHTQKYVHEMLVKV